MKIDYAYEVLEIINDAETGEQGAMVRYVPDDPAFGAFEVFVSVPWRKVSDTGAAREILRRKIAARAPLNEWRREYDAANPKPDNSEAIVNELERERQTAALGGRASAGDAIEPEGRRGITRVDRPDQPVREGSGAGGDAQGEAEAPPRR